MDNPWIKPIKVILPYLILSVIWIALSDRAVIFLFSDPELFARASTEKGVAFVIVTTALLYGLLVNEEKHNRRMQLKLEGSQASFQSFFASNPSATWVFDRETLKFVAVNPAALRQYGYTAEEFSSLTVLDIRPPEERERALKTIQIFTPQNGEVWIHRRKNGDLFEVRVTSHMIDFGGRKAILVVTDDISLTKKAREALLQETNRRLALEEIMNSGPAVVIQWLPIEGWPVEVISRNVHLFGYHPDDFGPQGLTLGKIIHPDDLVTIQNLVREWTSTQTREFTREYRILTASGEVRWVEDRCLVDYDPGGMPLRFNTLLWDTTERKLEEEEKHKAQVRLENSEQRLKDIIGFLPDATFAIDLNRRVILWNRAMEDVSGIAAADVIGQGDYEYSLPFYNSRRPLLVDFILSPTKEGLLDYYPGAEIDRSFLTAEVNVKSGKFGEIVRAKAGPLYDADGNIIGGIETLQDITQQKAAELVLKQDREILAERVKVRTAQLEEINQELEAFSYSVSHDLRAPLRHIDGFSQALMEDYAGILDENGQHYLNRIRSGTEHMAQLIEALLKLSRITRSELSIEPVDLSAIARAVMDEHRNQDPNRSIQFNCEDRLVVDGDAKLMRVVMENLLDNAWKFTSKTASATIEFGRCPDHADTFFLRDNGAGFDPTYSQKLFGAFQRLHSNSEFPGTGIGLATVSRILHRHEGRIWADGAVGAGATFYFTVPQKLS